MEPRGLEPLTSAVQRRRDGFVVVRHRSRMCSNKPGSQVALPRMFAIVHGGCRQVVVTSVPSRLAIANCRVAHGLTSREPLYFASKRAKAGRLGMTNELASVRESIDLLPREVLDRAEVFLREQGYDVTHRMVTSLTVERTLPNSAGGQEKRTITILVLPEKEGGLRLKVLGNDVDGVRKQQAKWVAWSEESSQVETKGAEVTGRTEEVDAGLGGTTGSGVERLGASAQLQDHTCSQAQQVDFEGRRRSRGPQKWVEGACSATHKRRREHPVLSPLAGYRRMQSSHRRPNR